MKKVFLIDLDHTIFNIDKFYKDSDQILTKTIKTNRKDFKNARQKYFKSISRPNDFNAKKYLQYIAKHFEANLNILNKVYFENKKLYQESIYPDAINFIKKLHKKYTLGIYSEGFKKYQKIKLINGGVFDYFNKNHIYIFRRKLYQSSLITLPKNSMIIDDNLKVIEKLSKTGKFNLIWLNRRSKKKHPKIKTIHNLKEKFI